MGLQLCFLLGTKEIHFFWFAIDCSLSLELSLWGSSDDEHLNVGVRCFWWRNLEGGAGEPGELFDVLALLADDGARSLGGDEHLYQLLLWCHEGAKGSSHSEAVGRRRDSTE